MEGLFFLVLVWDTLEEEIGIRKSHFLFTRHKSWLRMKIQTKWPIHLNPKAKMTIHWSLTKESDWVRS